MRKRGRGDKRRLCAARAMLVHGKIRSYFSRLVSSAEKPRIGQGRVYYYLEALAYEAKAAAQMLVGVTTVGWVAVSFVQKIDHPVGSVGATEELLGGIGVGLAVAAVIDLAYTLFTPGPDEALDPLMLGLAATMLVIVGGLDKNDFTLSKAASLLLLGLLLAVLFVIRLMLADTDSDDEPKVWWVRDRLGLPVLRKEQVDSDDPNAQPLE
jgi:hypothetical protein